MRYRYSRWDGSDPSHHLAATAVLDAVAEDLLASGDLAEVLQRLRRDGFEDGDGERVHGLSDLLQTVTESRHEVLTKYNLDSIVEEIAESIGDVAERERQARDAGCGDGSGPARVPVAGGASEDGVSIEGNELDDLGDEPGAALQTLSGYEFADEGARADFEGLMERLQRAELRAHADSLERSVLESGARGLPPVADALRDLNSMVSTGEGMRTGAFADLMERHGHHFPPAGSLPDLLEILAEGLQHRDVLLSSLSPTARRDLEGVLAAALNDPHLRGELTALRAALNRQSGTSPQPYGFTGQDGVTLEEGMDLVRQLRELDRLQGDLEHDPTVVPDPARIGNALGDAARADAKRLAGLEDRLVEEGFAARYDGALHLTARGIRQIGQKALEDIFRNLRSGIPGEHASSRAGFGVEPVEESKVYEFGDRFLLDTQRTLMNAVAASTPGEPLRLAPHHVEVHRTERQSGSATVLLLDLSRSMPLRGCLTAAKKVALALHALIRTQFPRDRLHIVGFADMARPIDAYDLPGVTCANSLHGTNIQHGLMLARRLLGRHRDGRRQIVVITDGEPTAYMEDGRVCFAYPPTERAFAETLREVRRCTQDGIVINTFMLDRSTALTEFVTRLTQVNGGRAFFASPDRLGDYIVLDYVSGNRRVDSLQSAEHATKLSSRNLSL